MAADAGIQAHSVNDVPGNQALGGGIGVQLVEVADPQGQIGIGEQLHRFRFRKAHEQCGDVLLDSTLLQKRRKQLRLFPGSFVTGDNNAGGVEIVVQGLTLPQEFRAENNVGGSVFFADGGGVAHGDGGLNDHDGIGIDLAYQLDHRFHRGGVEVILLAVIVGGGSNDHEIRISIGALAVQRGSQVQLLFRQIFFNILVLNGGLSSVDEIDLFRDDVHSGDMVVLGKQCGDGQSHIAGARHGNFAGFDTGLGDRFCFVHIQVGDLKIQHPGNGFQLIRRGFEGLVFQPSDHGAVDSGQIRQLCLGQVSGFTLCPDGFRQTGGRKFFHCVFPRLLLFQLQAHKS